MSGVDNNAREASSFWPNGGERDNFPESKYFINLMNRERFKYNAARSYGSIAGRFVTWKLSSALSIITSIIGAIVFGIITPFTPGGPQNPFEAFRNTCISGIPLSIKSLLALK